MGIATLCLIVVSFAAGLSFGPADLGTLRQRPRVAWVAAVVVMLLGLVLVYAAALLIPPPLETLAALLLVVMAPTATAAALLAGLTGGDVMLARAIVPLTVLLAAVTGPLIGMVLLGISGGAGLGTILPLLVPYVAGAFVAQRSAAAVARWASPVATAASLATLLLVAMALWQSRFAGFSLALIGALALLVVLTVTASFAGSLLRLSQGERRSLVLAATVRMVAVPLALILNAGEPGIALPVALYAVLMWVAGLAPLAAGRLRSA